MSWNMGCYLVGNLLTVMENGMLSCRKLVILPMHEIHYELNVYLQLDTIHSETFVTV